MARTTKPRTHGRCPCGQHVIVKIPHGRWRTLIFLAKLHVDRVEAPCVIDGPINGRSILPYVEQTLVPTLNRRDIAIIDDLGSHNTNLTRESIRNAGAKLLFLPPDIPDLNPIEQAFARLKNLLPKAK